MAAEDALSLEDQTTNSNHTGKVSLFSFVDSRYILLCFVIVCVTATLANSFLLVVIWKDPKNCLRTRSAFLITNLIISDLAGAVINITRLVRQIAIDELSSGEPIRHFHQPLVICGYIALLESLSTVFLISVEHLLAITQPLRFKILATNQVIAFAVSTSWINCAVTAVILFWAIPGRNHVFQAVSALNLLLLTSLPTIYTWAYHSLKQQLRVLDNVNGLSGKFDRKEKRILMRKRFLLTSAALILVYVGTCAPFTIYNYIKMSDNELYNPYMSRDEMGKILWIILSLNLFFDPFLYCLRIPQYRQSCLAMLMKLH